MFRPTSVTSHKVRLQYSEKSRQEEKKNHLRTNHGSFPSFRNSYDDLFTTAAATTEQLPSVQNPISLPGDCNVKEYILTNYKPYYGNGNFLSSPTQRTIDSWNKCEELMEEERIKGILDVDTKTVSTIVSHDPGYVLSKEKDIIKGLQTDEPLKRSCKPRGGFKIVQSALKSYGYEPDKDMEKIYTQVR